MDERRKLPRKYLMVYSRVFDRRDGRILGYLSDMNATGAMIISDDPLDLGKTVELRFDLPDPPIFSTDHLNINARVAWCRPDVDPAFHNIGFEFTDPSESQLRIVEEMIIAYEFRRDGAKYPPTITSLDDDL
jgi:Tfp pilus assembly protein PilZ